MAIVGVYFAVTNVSHASLILSINAYLSLLSGTDNISFLKAAPALKENCKLMARLWHF